jgi:acyl-CoA thioesterase-1
MRGSDIETFSVVAGAVEGARRACAAACAAACTAAFTAAFAAHCSLLLLATAATLTMPAAAQGPAAPPPAATATPTLLVLGDSLSAEYGLARGTGWVALLEARLAREPDAGKRAMKVVNASISGDTTSGGRSRLPALLALHKPQTVVIELGGNDALRGLPLPTTQANLEAMTSAAKASGAKVLIVGMAVPPNYGRQYGDDFTRLFATVARSQQAALVPFLLAGVADVPNADALFQPDRIHPKAEAHPRMLDNVWPVLRPLLPR